LGIVNRPPLIGAFGTMPARGASVHTAQHESTGAERGLRRLMAELYEPQAFFDRVDDWYIAGNA
jgi:hypothetical protein